MYRLRCIAIVVHHTLQTISMPASNLEILLDNLLEAGAPMLWGDSVYILITEVFNLPRYLTT